MRYAYYDLGDQPAGSVAVVRMRGSAANVILLNSLNFAYYRAGGAFFYDAGGHCLTSPVELRIPQDGHWYVVIDLGGYSGRIRASVPMLAPDEAQPTSESEEAVAEADASTNHRRVRRRSPSRSRARQVMAQDHRRSATRDFRKGRTERRSDELRSGAAP